MVKVGEDVATFASSNRTFMELKFVRSTSIDFTNNGSNRTFMELKCLNLLLDLEAEGVLIAPLWN